jgi:hypothetical protein
LLKSKYVKLRLQTVLLLLLISLISCTSDALIEIPPTETVSSTVIPTQTRVPPTATITPTMVPTGTPTPKPTATRRPTATKDPCLRPNIFEFNGVDGFKADIFLELDESMSEQVKLYNNANGTSLEFKSLILVECELPEGGFDVVPLLGALDEYGNPVVKYFVLDPNGYCLLECDIVVLVKDWSQGKLGEGYTIEYFFNKMDDRVLLGGLFSLERAKGESMENFFEFTRRPGYPELYSYHPFPHYFMASRALFAKEYLYAIDDVKITYP